MLVDEFDEPDELGLFDELDVVDASELDPLLELSPLGAEEVVDEEDTEPALEVSLAVDVLDDSPVVPVADRLLEAVLAPAPASVPPPPDELHASAARTSVGIARTFGRGMAIVSSPLE